MGEVSRFWQRLKASDELRALLRGSAATFVMKVMGSLAALGVAILLARFLGATDAGIFYTAMSAAFLVGTVSRFGMPALLMRETAAAIAGCGAGYRQTLGRIWLVFGVGGILGAAVLVGGSGLAADFYGHSELRVILSLWGITILSVALLTGGGQIIRGAQMFGRSAFIGFASVSIFHFFFLGVFALGLAEKLGISPLMSALYGHIAAVLCTAVIAIWWSLGALRKVSGGGWADDFGLPMGRLLHSGFSLMTNILSSSAMRWADTLILAAFVAAADVAIYNSAARIEAFVIFLAMTMGTVSGPRLSGAYKNGRWLAVIAAFRNATFLGAVLVVPVAAALWVGSPWVMGVFGEEFVAGAIVLNVLVIGAVVSALTGPYGELLIAAGQERHVRNGALTGLMIGITLHFLLIPLYGAVGAAIATTVSVAWQHLWNLAWGWFAVGMAPPWLHLMAGGRWRQHAAGMLASRHQPL